MCCNITLYELRGPQERGKKFGVENGEVQRRGSTNSERSVEVEVVVSYVQGRLGIWGSRVFGVEDMKWASC